MSRTSPVKGQVYTTHQIDNELELRDSPHFGFYNDAGEKDVVQDSHLAVDISTLPGWADLRWTFVRETHEWIPIFQIFNEEDSAKLKMLLRLDSESSDVMEFYEPITPEGYQRNGIKCDSGENTDTYIPKKYRMVDVKGLGTTLDYSGEFTLQKLVGATDWSDEDFDRISELKAGEKIEFDDGNLIVERIN